jgi:hypothetical protein
MTQNIMNSLEAITGSNSKIIFADFLTLKGIKQISRVLLLKNQPTLPCCSTGGTAEILRFFSEKKIITKFIFWFILAKISANVTYVYTK